MYIKEKIVDSIPSDSVQNHIKRHHLKIDNTEYMKMLFGLIPYIGIIKFCEFGKELHNEILNDLKDVDLRKDLVSAYMFKMATEMLNVVSYYEECIRYARENYSDNIIMVSVDDGVEKYMYYSPRFDKSMELVKSMFDTPEYENRSVDIKVILLSSLLSNDMTYTKVINSHDPKSAVCDSSCFKFNKHGEPIECNVRGDMDSNLSRYQSVDKFSNMLKMVCTTVYNPFLVNDLVKIKGDPKVYINSGYNKSAAILYLVNLTTIRYYDNLETSTFKVTCSSSLNVEFASDNDLSPSDKEVYDKFCGKTS